MLIPTDAFMQKVLKNFLGKCILIASSPKMVVTYPLKATSMYLLCCVMPIFSSLFGRSLFRIRTWTNWICRNVLINFTGTAFILCSTSLIQMMFLPTSWFSFFIPSCLYDVVIHQHKLHDTVMNNLLSYGTKILYTIHNSSILKHLQSISKTQIRQQDN